MCQALCIGCGKPNVKEMQTSPLGAAHLWGIQTRNETVTFGV